ncbi:unnamed protein product [Pseudo-nitzschia multistriata]|uniref:Uncharacterized protein n=1 Tax=Pseudo-nitzschia multistriata TaxID=183589 RepID=A0A448ZJ62_9STRA|nr:unnamed protein product [Pseudo-nitzschia multistriata]
MKLSVHNNTHPLLAALLATSLFMSKVWSAEDHDMFGVPLNKVTVLGPISGYSSPDWKPEEIDDVEYRYLEELIYPSIDTWEEESYKTWCFKDGFQTWESVPGNQTMECTSRFKHVNRRTVNITITRNYGICVGKPDIHGTPELPFNELMQAMGLICDDFLVSTEAAPVTDDQESTAPLIGVFASASIAVGMAGAAMIL